MENKEVEIDFGAKMNMWHKLYIQIIKLLHKEEFNNSGILGAVFPFSSKFVYVLNPKYTEIKEDGELLIKDAKVGFTLLGKNIDFKGDF